MRLIFTIDGDDISAARLEEYKAQLNELLGIEGQWEVIRETRESVTIGSSEPSRERNEIPLSD